MSRPPLAALTLALLWGFASALPAFGQDEPAAEPTENTPAGSPAADAPQKEVTPDEKTDDEQPPADPKPEDPKGTADETDAEKPADKPAADAKAEPTPELLVENLETPVGLAIAPQSGDVMIATRWGVYRYVPHPDPSRHAIFIEVEGYDVPDTIGEDGQYKIGPLSVAFAGDSELVVGGGSAPEGEEVVQTFQIALEPRGDDPQIQDTDAKQSAGPVGPSEVGGEGAGNFTGVLVGENAVYVATSSTTPKGWILKASLEDGKLGPLEPFIAAADVAEIGGPGPMAWDADKNLVVGLWGGAVPGDDAIAVFSPAGELVAKYEGDIGEFGGMAYSPKTKALYVTDMGLSTDRGGLYKVTLADGKMTAEKVLALDKPAGLAFAPDGKLYVTTLGTPVEGKTTPDGGEFSAGALHLIDAGL